MITRLLIAIALSAAPLSAQLLDQIVARVNGSAITQTDINAAVGLGVIEAATAVQQMVDRQLMIVEVARFPPDSPTEAAIDALVARMKAHAGAGYDALLTRNGVDERRVRDMARDTLRIEAYVDQRFGSSAQASAQDARDYYERNREQFTRNGVLAPFESVEAAARQGASAERRTAAVGQWLQGLRTRGDVVIPRPSRP
jgi:hypothetical protein